MPRFKFLAFVLSSFYFFYYGILGVFIPYWGRYLYANGFDSKQIGALIGIIGVGKIIAPNWWAYLADRSGRRLLIIRLGALLTLTSFTLLLQNQGFYTALFGFALFSFFWNAMMPQIEVITLSITDNNTHLYGRIRLWGSVGFICMATGLGFAIDYASIAVVPDVITVLFMCLFVNTLFLQSQVLAVKQAYNKTGFSDFIKGALTRQCVVFFAVYFMLQMSHAPYYTFFDLYMNSVGISTKIVGLLISLGVIAEIGMFMVAGKLIARFSLIHLLHLALFVTAVRWFILAFFPQWLLLVIVSQLLHAVSFGLCHAIAVSWIFKTFPSGQKSQGQALYSSVSWGLGGAIGNFIAGLSWANGQGATITFVGAGLICLLAMLVLSYGFATWRKTK